jgi:acetate kinase
MEKRLLVLNVGSLTLKFAVFSGRKLLAKGICEDIGGRQSNFVFNDRQEKIKIKTHEAALKLIISSLIARDLDFDVIIHRVVHGGKFDSTREITDDVKAEIRKFSDAAPNHNPFELQVIEDCENLGKKQFAVFDTAFFTELPQVAKTYPIPQDIASKYKIKRYGFHGVSHYYVSQGLKGKTITCHLGNGCSVAALVNGKPVDTSMGFTPLEGLMMGTRAGSIDPGIVIFLAKKGYNVEKMINFQSGFKAFTDEIDFRHIVDNLKEKKIKLAYDLFVYSIIKQIGAYVAVLNGLDNLVFTGGIGEHHDIVRSDVCKNLEFLNVKLDEGKNKSDSELISSSNSEVKVYVRPTDEEKIMAEEVLKLMK